MVASLCFREELKMMMEHHKTLLRIAVPTDALEIAQIWREGLELSGHYKSIPSIHDTVSAFQQRLEAPQGRSRIWVATNNGVVIGWQGLSDLGVTQITKAAMSSTYVAAHRHSKGVGRQLLACATENAENLGFDYVVGFIRTDNAVPIRIVLSLGWTLVGVLPRNHDGATELAYYAYAVPKPNAN
jgi:L-amino acid N-acyltransferase YncA